MKLFIEYELSLHPNQRVKRPHHIQPPVHNRGTIQPFKINFPGASTQTPQGCLPPASQERGIRPNLATLGASLRDASIGECTLNDSNLPPPTYALLYHQNSSRYSTVPPHFPTARKAWAATGCILKPFSFFQES